MAALLKEVYTKEYIEHLASTVLTYYPSLDKTQLVQGIFNTQWPQMELKARTLHITQQLHCFITLNYRDALQIIKHIAPYFTGYEGLFVPAFVELYGIDDPQASLDALAYITTFASAEFAVRPFIKKYPELMQQTLLRWAVSENKHVRRLASEGCRPRLPWAMSLPAFKKDPHFILPVLQLLRDDESEYVRRSVANNLNDIAKDHPQSVTHIAQQWLAESQSLSRQRLVKHACRTLLKQADPMALSLFGFLPPEDIHVTDFLYNNSVPFGGELHFSCLLKQQKDLPLNKLRIEFAIDFMKKNGKQARKIFQLSEAVIKASSKKISKTFSFKKISTRQYYAGQHSVAILINGVELVKNDFILQH